MIGTKHTELSEGLCTGIMSGIVVLCIKKINEAFIVFQNLSISIIIIFLLKKDILHKIKSCMNFNSSVRWGPRYKFSNWAPQFLAPALPIHNSKTQRQHFFDVHVADTLWSVHV